MRRMVIIDSAQPTAPASTAAVPSALAAPPPPGTDISSTPPKPTSTAAPRRGPTFSPSSGIDSRVRNSGMVKPSAVTVASGSTA